MRRLAHVSGKRVAQVLALGFAVAAAATILVIPSYMVITTDSAGRDIASMHTVLEVGGPWFLAVLAIPIVITIVPLLVRGRAWQPVSIVATVLLGVFTLVALLTIGMYFLPALVASVVGAVLPSGTAR